MSASSGTSSPISLGIAGAFTRRSLGNLRRLLARSGELNGLTLVTTTMGFSASVITSLDLAGGLDTDAYRGAWVMPTQSAVDPGASNGVVRRVGNQGLAPTGGQLTVTIPFPSPIPTGVDVEIHTALPPVSRDGFPGLRHCLNQALAECWFPQRFSISGVAGQYDYSLAAYADWLDPEAIFQFLSPSVGGLSPLPQPGWSYYRNAEGLYVQADLLQAGAAYSAGVMRQGDTYIKSGGVWADSSAGLVADTDEQLFQPNFLVEVALVYAYEALARGDRADYWVDKAAKQRIRANWLKFHYLPHPTAQDTFGPPRSTDPKDFASWPIQ